MYSATLEPLTVSGLFTVRGRKVHGGLWVAASFPGLREPKKTKFPPPLYFAPRDLIPTEQQVAALEDKQSATVPAPEQVSC